MAAKPAFGVKTSHEDQEAKVTRAYSKKAKEISFDHILLLAVALVVVFSLVGLASERAHRLYIDNPLLPLVVPISTFLSAVIGGLLTSHK